MSFLKALGYITGGATVSYLTLTAMMQDPKKPYRGHLNVIIDDSLDEYLKFPTLSWLNMKISMKSRFPKLYGYYDNSKDTLETDNVNENED